MTKPSRDPSRPPCGFSALRRDEVYRALQLVEGWEPPTAFEKLITAWNRCTDEDRFRFLVAIGVEDDSGEQ